MKGGRLHRPEPPAPRAAAPAAAPADDWVDGSWTVDCSCGVTFDDGEEMVSCDECNVWVHTRCARYVRGVHTSFSCHNCRSKRPPASADEAEVAELLAELPTHRPPPLYRRWAEVPLPARVHVHGLPGGSDASLFRSASSSTVFTAALWRCAGYVPKRFGFRYCEFPSWADDKDGADALFALAREKRKEAPEGRFPLPLGGVQKEENYVRTLSRSSKKAGNAERAPPLSEAKKRGTSVSAAEDDTYEAGFQQKGDLAVPDGLHEDQYTKLNMASSDLPVLFEAKKIGISLERSGEKKSSEEIPGMLKKDESMESMRLEVPFGIRAKTAVAEQEVHSRSAKEEVCMYKQQIGENQNAGLQCGIMNSAVKMNKDKDKDKPSDGDVPIHAGLQKQTNQTSSNLQVVGVLNLQIGRMKSQNIKSEATSDDHERTEDVQSISNEHKSDKQGLGCTTGSLIIQKNSSINAVFSEHLKSEAQNQLHGVAENSNSNLGVVKVYGASSGSTSTNFEFTQSLVPTESAAAVKTVHLMKKEQPKFVSPADSKHNSTKHSEETSHEFMRYSEKVPLKGSPASAPKSSQGSRTHMPSGKQKLAALKDQSQKTAITGGTPARFHGEVAPAHSRSKAIPSSFSQKRDKTNPRFIHTTQEGSNNPTSTELLSSDATASLSDEQLALLLHQQLNSSPRVPRVPRCHQAASMQILHPTGGSVFSKRSSANGGRDQTTLLKKRNKDDLLRENDDTKRRGKVSFVERRHRDSSTERVLSLKDSCRLSENIESEQQNLGICLTGATTNLAKDDLIGSSVSRNLRGLIDEIISKNRNISYGELCDTVHQRWRDLSKTNGDDCVYSNYVHAVNDCLRNRSEWAYLLDQAPKMNPNKRRKVESEIVSADVLETEKMTNGSERDSEDGSAESHQEDLPMDKRKTRKRRRLELKGRRVKETRSSIDSSSEDAATALSDSSNDRNDAPMDDESQEDNYVAPDTLGCMEPKSADSSSQDGG